MSTNEVGQDAVASIESDENSNEDNESTVTLKIDPVNCSSNNGTAPESSSNTLSPEERFQKTLQELHMELVAMQSKSNNPVNGSTLAPGTSLLRPEYRNMMPSPQIPKQFQKSVDALNAKKIAPILATTPSGCNSATVNHANRSVVYPEPVSTIRTAPTKNFITKSTSDIDTNQLAPSHSEYSAPAAQYSSIKTIKLDGSSVTISLLKPKINLNPNESVNVASIDPTQTNQAHLEQTNLDNDIHRNGEQYIISEYLDGVSHMCSYCFFIL